MRIAIGLSALVLLFAVAAAWQRYLSPSAKHRDIVREFMTDPDSAVFRDEFMGPGTTTVWCGRVNARNRMGGMTGFTRYVLLLDPVRPADAAFATLSFDKRSEGAGDAAFDGTWKVYCQEP